MDPIFTFGSWIRRRRKALDLTQEALAQRLGYSVASLRKIESGERRASKQIAERLAEVLGIAPADRTTFFEAARRHPDAAQPIGAELIGAQPIALSVDRTAPPGAPPAATPATTRAFPSRASFTVLQAGIPADVSSFIGREREVAALLRLLRRPGVRLITLAGPPGIGKTRLALRVAESVCDDYADGAAYVDLLPAQDENQVTGAVATALGVREEPGRTLLQTVQEYLRPKHLLLVLDNFEQAIQAAPLVTALLMAAPAAKALVTSRILLDLRGEHVFNVPPLASPDLLSLPAEGAELVALLETYESVLLFAERSQARLAEFELTPANARPVAEICRLLDGLPLAIELAAARSALLPPDALLAALTAGRFDPLRTSLRDAPARQQTLRGAIEWSYNLLPEAEQRLWRRLAVFSGGFTLEAAQAVCGESSADGTGHTGADTDEVAVGLAALIRESLAWRATTGSGKPRYHQLPMIQEYGLERLNRSGEADVIRRSHAEYFAALAMPPSVPTWEGIFFDHVQAEHGNIVAALDWCHNREETLDLEVRMSTSMSTFWEGRGHVREGRYYLERCLARRNLPRDIREKLIELSGMAAFRQGDLPAARRYFETELALRREDGEPIGVARALNHLGRTFLDAGDMAGARVCCDEGLALCQAHASSNGIAMFTNDLGEIARLEGDYELAGRMYLEALVLFREIGAERSLAWPLQNLGYVALQRGAYQEARAYFEEALALFDGVGYPFGVAACVAGFGCLALSQGQAALAVRLLAASEAVRQSIGAVYQAAERAELERGIVSARQALTPAAFQAQWAAGQRMSAEEAMALARQV